MRISTIAIIVVVAFAVAWFVGGQDGVHHLVAGTAELANRGARMLCSGPCLR